MEEFKGSNIFLNIPVFIADDPDLTDKQLLIFGEIFSMLNVTSAFFMSNEAIAKRRRCTVRTVQIALDKLESKGYIKRHYVTDEKNNTKRNITLGGELNFMGGMKFNSWGERNEFHGGDETDFTQIEHINKTTNRSSSTPTPSKNVFNKLKKIGIPENGMNTPVIIDYIDQLGDDLVAHAIDYMADQAQRPNMNYLKKILEGYLNKNIKTVAQAKQSEEAFKTQQTTYANKRSNRRRIVQKETLPDWAQEGYQVPKLSDEDRVALEAKRKKLEAKMFGKKDK
ncbi:DnaD domain protein [Ligilactobacillus equi]|uniref:Putative phage replication protein n=1 Tax=Ligilactobacillus equi DPC 6820 TaxID=1392007 RepID=V7HXP6_9LACO|nr:DnaD domain protein [Ligilactobacillus equi]ETA74065.1 putative phage replication protein [Ligilactobacillus equi DPC 6820]